MWGSTGTRAPGICTPTPTCPTTTRRPPRPPGGWRSASSTRCSGTSKTLAREALLGPVHLRREVAGPHPGRRLGVVDPVPQVPRRGLGGRALDPQGRAPRLRAVPRRRRGGLRIYGRALGRGQVDERRGRRRGFLRLGGGGGEAGEGQGGADHRGLRQDTSGRGHVSTILVELTGRQCDDPTTCATLPRSSGSRPELFSTP